MIARILLPVVLILIILGLSVGWVVNSSEESCTPCCQIEGDLRYLISEIQYAKELHEEPSASSSGSPEWHQRWVDLYTDVLDILEQTKHCQELE